MSSSGWCSRKPTAGGGHGWRPTRSTVAATRRPNPMMRKAMMRRVQSDGWSATFADFSRLSRGRYGCQDILGLLMLR